MTEQLWAGEFGNQYTERNAEAGGARGPFWGGLLARHPVRSVLEIGCNAGANLQWLTRLVSTVGGVDVNERALKDLLVRKISPEAYVVDPARTILARASITGTLPTKITDQPWDLVFTCGVLIHIAPADLANALQEIVTVAQRYVLVIEYYAAVETVVPYRGQAAALWKRPYGELVQAQFPRLQLLEQGELAKTDGFDDCTYWLWRKA